MAVLNRGMFNCVTWISVRLFLELPSNTLILVFSQTALLFIHLSHTPSTKIVSQVKWWRFEQYYWIVVTSDHFSVMLSVSLVITWWLELVSAYLVSVLMFPGHSKESSDFVFTLYLNLCFKLFLLINLPIFFRCGARPLVSLSEPWMDTSVE